LESRRLGDNQMTERCVSMSMFCLSGHSASLRPRVTTLTKRALTRCCSQRVTAPCNSMPLSEQKRLSSTAINRKYAREDTHHCTGPLTAADLVCLSADGLIVAEASFPHGARGGPGEKEPTGLNRQCLRERCALQPPEENGDRAK